MRCVFLIFVALVCNAQSVCPYLGAATAAGVLGEKVAISVTPGDHKEDATCQFDGSAVNMRVEVRTMSNRRAEFPSFLAQCGADATALRGIGNEAVACASSGKNGEVYDQVLSRVREQALLVRVTAKAKRADRAALREQSSKVAEMVAGFLF